MSVEYHDGVPKRLSAVVIAQQHLEHLSETNLKEEILEKVIMDGIEHAIRREKCRQILMNCR